MTLIRHRPIIYADRVIIQVCVDPRTSDFNMTLPPLSIDICRPPGQQQQGVYCRGLLGLTDVRTDGHRTVS